MDEALDELIAIVELLKDAEFTQFRFQQGDFLVEISRGAPLPSAGAPATSTPTQPASAVDAAPAEPPSPSVTASPPPALAGVDTSGAVTVESPMLGTFYGSPKPGEPPFVQVGDVVAADTVVCIVEVMKLMNSVSAGVAGTVLEVAATDGQLVESGTPLFLISPAE